MDSDSDDDLKVSFLSHVELAKIIRNSSEVLTIFDGDSTDRICFLSGPEPLHFNTSLSAVFQLYSATLFLSFHQSVVHPQLLLKSFFASTVVSDNTQTQLSLIFDSLFSLFSTEDHFDALLVYRLPKTFSNDFQVNQLSYSIPLVHIIPEFFEENSSPYVITLLFCSFFTNIFKLKKSKFSQSIQKSFFSFLSKAYHNPLTVLFQLCSFYLKKISRLDLVENFVSKFPGVFDFFNCLIENNIGLFCKLSDIVAQFLFFNLKDKLSVSSNRMSQNQSFSELFRFVFDLSRDESVVVLSNLPPSIICCELHHKLIDLVLNCLHEVFNVINVETSKLTASDNSRFVIVSPSDLSFLTSCHRLFRLFLISALSRNQELVSNLAEILSSSFRSIVGLSTGKVAYQSNPITPNFDTKILLKALNIGQSKLNRTFNLTFESYDDPYLFSYFANLFSQLLTSIGHLATSSVFVLVENRVVSLEDQLYVFDIIVESESHVTLLDQTLKTLKFEEKFDQNFVQPCFDSEDDSILLCAPSDSENENFVENFEEITLKFPTLKSQSNVDPSQLSFDGRQGNSFKSQSNVDPSQLSFDGRQGNSFKSQSNVDPSQLSFDGRQGNSFKSQSNVDPSQLSFDKSQGNSFKSQSNVDPSQLSFDGRQGNSFKSQSNVDPSQLSFGGRQENSFKSQSNVDPSQLSFGGRQENSFKSQSNVDPSQSSFDGRQGNSFKSQSNVDPSQSSFDGRQGNSFKSQSNVDPSQSSFDGRQGNSFKSQSNVDPSQSSFDGLQGNSFKSQSNVDPSQLSFDGRQGNSFKSQSNVDPSQLSFDGRQGNSFKSQSNVDISQESSFSNLFSQLVYSLSLSTLQFEFGFAHNISAFLCSIKNDWVSGAHDCVLLSQKIKEFMSTLPSRLLNSTIDSINFFQIIEPIDHNCGLCAKKDEIPIKFDRKSLEGIYLKLKKNQSFLIDDVIPVVGLISSALSSVSQSNPLSRDHSIAGVGIQILIFLLTKDVDSAQIVVNEIVTNQKSLILSLLNLLDVPLHSFQLDLCLLCCNFLAIISSQEVNGRALFPNFHDEFFKNDYFDRIICVVHQINSFLSKISSDAPPINLSINLIANYSSRLKEIQSNLIDCIINFLSCPRGRTFLSMIAKISSIHSKFRLIPVLVQVVVLSVEEMTAVGDVACDDVMEDAFLSYKKSIEALTLCAWHFASLNCFVTNNSTSNISAMNLIYSLISTPFSKIVEPCLLLLEAVFLSSEVDYKRLYLLLNQIILNISVDSIVNLLMKVCTSGPWSNYYRKSLQSFLIDFCDCDGSSEFEFLRRLPKISEENILENFKASLKKMNQKFGLNVN
ncbi:hypothetical protein RCL1_004808 [Eukaryota sp. TZLM3-RCL]